MKSKGLPLAQLIQEFAPEIAIFCALIDDLIDHKQQEWATAASLCPRRWTPVGSMATWVTPVTLSHSAIATRSRVVHP